MSETIMSPAEISGYRQIPQEFFRQDIPAFPSSPVEEMSSPPWIREHEEELDAFREFLAGHLKPVGNADVQCMLVWSEWVRVHYRGTKKFPRLIMEDELREIILALYHTTITLDEHRGKVYPGIRYVP